MSATYGSRREATAVAEDAAAATRGLYERHGQRVFTFCVSRLRDAEEAQDATQTTFLYAMRSLDNGVKPRFERAWLLAIAHNVCRSTRRSLDRRASRASFADVTELEAAAESLGEETGEELAWIREALERLPETQRRAILLREWQGLSYADIANELHLSLAAVETLLFRARRSLAAQLDHAKRGLKAFDLSSLGFLLRNAVQGGAVKTAVVAAGLAAAVGPLPSAVVPHETKAAPFARHLEAGASSGLRSSRPAVRPPRHRGNRRRPSAQAVEPTRRSARVIAVRRAQPEASPGRGSPTRRPPAPTPAPARVSAPDDSPPLLAPVTSVVGTVTDAAPQLPDPTGIVELPDLAP